MCGIFGHNCLNQNNIEYSRYALNSLKHRGPDQEGDYAYKNIYLGHRRLSIIDLSVNGRQPMIDNDSEVVLTINGEIYNYRELYEELAVEYQFNSSSDSEVVLVGYKLWGIEKLLSKLEGMFAFCIYDIEKNHIIIARDRIGIKPLYYYWNENNIAWASELKALSAFFSDLKYDYTALYDFLTYQYIPNPKSLYQHIYKLEPGSYIRFNDNSKSFAKYKYWTLPIDNRFISINEAQEELKSLIFNSVKDQMVSDVPLGFFLSGGIDSSLVVSNAANADRSIKTFTIGFKESDHDETMYAENLAHKIGTQHFQKILDAKTALEYIPLLKNWYDEPFADTSAFPSFMVSKFAKENVTVVLTGDGGDEIFGGYKWYKKFQYFNAKKKYRLLKNVGQFKNHFSKNSLSYKVLKRCERNWFLSDFELYTKLLGGLIKSEKTNYAKIFRIPKDYDDYYHFRKFLNNNLTNMKQLQYIDFHTYLPDDILTKVDRVSMAVSLEARVPLLSTKLVEFMFSLPEDITMPGGLLKGLVKNTYLDILSEELMIRPKKGFSIPLNNWSNDLFTKYQTPQEYILNVLYKNLL